jgi:integrase
VAADSGDLVGAASGFGESAAGRLAQAVGRESLESDAPALLPEPLRESGRGKGTAALVDQEHDVLARRCGYLNVGENGKSKSWVQLISRGGFGKKGRSELGLGSYPEVLLAGAREKGGALRALAKAGTDPVQQRKEQRRRGWLADANNVTFKAMADDFIQNKSTVGPEPWRESTRKDAEYVLNKYLVSLHDRPVAKIEARHVYDEVLKPLLGNTIAGIPTRGRSLEKARLLAQAVFDWAQGQGPDVFPADKLNPASKKAQAVLLHGFKHHPSHLPALDWQKVTAFVTKLREFIKREYFTLGEATQATGLHRQTILHAIYDGRLKAEKDPFGSHHWQVEPAELFKVWPQVTEVTPTPQSIAGCVILFSILTATRPSEARMMTKFEYDLIERLWTIPWQRTKEGRKIRQDHVIPLSRQAIEIIETLLAQQRRFGIESDYIFAQIPNARTHGRANVKIGMPPCSGCVRDVLKRLLDLDDKDKTWHAMRTAFRSWGDEQRRPDGSPRFAEKDLERAIGHIAGFGKTEVSRIYSRQSRGLQGLVPIFDLWADFIFGGSNLSAKVIPIRHQAEQATGG